MGQLSFDDAREVAEFNRQRKEWATPLLSADVTLVTLEEDVPKVLLIKRGKGLFRGKWSLPGALVRSELDSTTADTALRALAGKAHVRAPYVEQLRCFSGASRDPRGWSASDAFICLLPRGALDLKKSENGDEPHLVDFETAMGMPLCFDHSEMLSYGIDRLRSKVNYSSLPAYLLPEKFTLPELQRVYESILGSKLDKPTFRKKILDSELLVPLEGEMRQGPNRPAQIYQLRSREDVQVFRSNLLGASFK